MYFASILQKEVLDPKHMFGSVSVALLLDVYFIVPVDQLMELTNKHPPFLVLTHDFTVEGDDTDRALRDSFV